MKIERQTENLDEEVAGRRTGLLLVDMKQRRRQFGQRIGYDT
jgi:hypothetical protein